MSRLPKTLVAAVDAALEKKALDVRVLDLRKAGGFTDYFMLVVGCFVIFAGAMAVIAVIVSALGFLSLLLGFVVEFWALLACFALIGTVLRAHRTQLEIAGEHRPRDDETRAQQHREWHKSLDIAYVAFRSGMYSSGYKTLHDFVDANGDSIEVNHWLVENMIDWQDKRYALEVAAKLMPRLLERGDAVGALELYRRCRRRDPDFTLPREQADLLARHAADFGQTGVAAELSYNR